MFCSDNNFVYYHLLRQINDIQQLNMTGFKVISTKIAPE